jgi:hypothetical protein
MVVAVGVHLHHKPLSLSHNPQIKPILSNCKQFYYLFYTGCTKNTAPPCMRSLNHCFYYKNFYFIWAQGRRGAGRRLKSLHIHMYETYIRYKHILFYYIHITLYKYCAPAPFNSKINNLSGARTVLITPRIAPLRPVKTIGQ